MSYILKDEMAKAAKKTIYGSIDLANDRRSYIRANSAPQIADIVIARLKQLSEGAEAHNGIPASTTISALHFKKAIHDFGETVDVLFRKGDQDGAKIASEAHKILVNAYLASTNDPDVFRALPKETILDLETLG